MIAYTFIEIGEELGNAVFTVCVAAVIAVWMWSKVMRP